MGECSNRTLVGAHAPALTHHPRLNFGSGTGGACDIFTGLGDGIKWALSDAIVQYAGYTGVLGTGISTSLQGGLLGGGSLATAIAQKVYVSN